jgi:hypothetical protein
LKREELLLAGTWGQANSKMATGIYSAVVDPFNRHVIQFYDFSELNHFFDYLSPRKAAKIKSRARRRKDEGKLPQHRAYLNVCKLEENDDGFVLLSEIYSPASNSSPYATGYPTYPYSYPPYSTGGGYYPSNTYNPYYYNPYGNYGTRYSRTDVTVHNSSVVVFDSQGRIKEDASCKFSETMHLPSLDQVSDFNYTDKKIVQVYKGEMGIRVSVSQDDGGPPARSTEKIQLKSPDEILRNESFAYGVVRHWFDSYLFVWGYETIKEKKQPGSPARHVFYVNKLNSE